MVYRIAEGGSADAGDVACFATREYVLRNKIKAEWSESWDLQPSRLDELGLYYPEADPFAPKWSKFS
jgi:hypothetical protein